MGGLNFAKATDLRKVRWRGNCFRALLKKNKPQYQICFVFIFSIVVAVTFFRASRFKPYLLQQKLSNNLLEGRYTFNLPSFFEISRFDIQGSVLSKEVYPLHVNDTNSIPSSIAAHFLQHGANACGIEHVGPYIPALRAAFMAYGLTKPESSFSAQVQSESTITIQICKEDDFWDLRFMNEAINATREYSNVVLVPVLIYNSFSSIDTGIRRFVSFLRKQHPLIAVMVFRPSSIDDAMYLLSTASNLFVHGGATGALAALSNGNGKIRLSYDMARYLRNNIFKWMVQPIDEYDESNILLKGVKETFSAMGAVRSTCCNFEPFGKGDDEKIVCKNARDIESETCWVLSLGCNNKWGFEEEIVARTTCHVHVFDCTGNFSVPEPIKHRVTFHRICLDSQSRMRGNREYRPFAQMIQIGSQQFGSLVPPVIAKVDVEGWEVPGLSAFLSMKSVRKLLPHQILMEIHALARQIFIGIPDNLRLAGGRYETATKVYAEFFSNLSSVGYELVHRADNPFCWKCSEVNLLLKSRAPLVYA